MGCSSHTQRMNRCSSSPAVNSRWSSSPWPSSWAFFSMWPSATLAARVKVAAGVQALPCKTPARQAFLHRRQRAVLEIKAAALGLLRRVERSLHSTSPPVEGRSIQNGLAVAYRMPPMGTHAHWRCAGFVADVNVKTSDLIHECAHILNPWCEGRVGMESGCSERWLAVRRKGDSIGVRRSMERV